MISDVKKEEPSGKATVPFRSNVPSIPNNASNEKLLAALSFLKDGYSIFPVGSDKRPIIASWARLQTKQSTEAEIMDWWQKNPNANIALVCGFNGLAVLDIDVKNAPANQNLADTIAAAMKGHTVVVRTPSGGIHVYLHETDTVSRTVRLKGIGDFQALGTYVLAPPSDGYHYES